MPPSRPLRPVWHQLARPKHPATGSISKQCYSTTFRPLPPINEWRTHFPPHVLTVRDRVAVRNPETAAMLARSYFHEKSIAGGSKKIIIEAFPGPGQLSRALLQLPSSQVHKLIILEDYEPYLEYLRPLTADPRVTVVPMSGHDWDTYNYLEEQGLLDEVETLPWEGGVHPQLHFISHIPHTVKGEQLVAQLFRCIPAKSWLFKFGRVPMSFILGEWMWERITAPHGTRARCKVGVIAEASASLQNSVRPGLLTPYDDHFHPIVARGPHANKRPESRRIGHPQVSVNIVPFADQVIDSEMLDIWDYVLRRMFILKGTALKSAIGSLAVGAQSLIKTLTSDDLPPSEYVDVNKKVRDLTIAEWALVARAFHNWPFAPAAEDLAITGSLNERR